jgi:hypothetical protein
MQGQEGCGVSADREFLFSYHFGGKTWGTSVFAADEAEAKEKIKAVGMARYDGELAMRIPAALPCAGLFTRFMCWWKSR